MPQVDNGTLYAMVLFMCLMFYFIGYTEGKKNRK